MTRADDRELLRRIAAGRAPGATAGRGGEGDGAGRTAELDRLAALWAELEPAAAEPSPPGFTGRVMARVRDAGGPHAAARRGTLARRPGAVPARLAAGAALTAGLVAGLGLGALVAAPGGGAERRAPIAAAEHAVPAPGSGSGQLDDEGLLAAAVAAAAGGRGGGESAEAPAAPSTAEPDLADGYLAALGALEEAS